MEFQKLKNNRWMRICWSSLVQTFLCLCVLGGALGGNHLPEEFDQICRVEETILQTKGHFASKILCQLGPSDSQKWRLDVLRNWTMGLKPDSESFSYEITCSELGGNLSLPFPFKCAGLNSLTVRNCNITDIFSDFENPVINSIPPSLTKLEIHDSRMIQKRSEILEMFANVGKLTSDYECLHPETIEKIIYRNVSYVIDDDLHLLMEECYGAANALPSNPELQTLSQKDSESTVDMNITMVMEESTIPVTHPKSSLSLSDVTPSTNEVNSRKRRALDKCAFLNIEKLMSIPKKLDDLHLLCDFEKLLILEDSSNSVVPVLETRFLEKYNRYPALQLFNYSNNNINSLPPELSDWSFLFYDIRHIDLSYNLLKTFSFTTRYSSSAADTYINLQNNNITTLTAENFENFQDEENFLIDVKNNPFVCDCNIKDFVKSVSKQDVFSGTFKKYRYLKSLECTSPPHLAGRTMGSLTMEDLGCDPEVINAALTFLIVGVVMFFLIPCVVVSCIYRKEVKGFVRSRCQKNLKPLASNTSDGHSDTNLQTVINMSTKKHDSKS